MSIRGTSYNGGTDGALVNFDVGAAGALFTGAFTVVALVKTSNTAWGIFGGFSDAVGTTQEGGLLIGDNSGGRLYSVADFTAGFPDPGTVASPGLSDSVWRWVGISKDPGAAHYRYHYADLATLTWVHGESVGSANHGNAGTCVAFSTWSFYALGNDSGDMAALAAFTSKLSDGAIEAAATQAANDLASASPTWGVLFPAATAGSAVSDFTGGNGDETFRQLVTTSTDPADFDFTLDGIGATITPSTIAAVAAFPAATVSGVVNASITPAAISAVAAFPAATKSGGATVTPATVTATATLPAPGVRTGSTVSPAAVAAVAALPAPSIGSAVNATITPAKITAVATLPAPTVQAVTNATITPATIAAVAALPSPTLSPAPGGVVVYTRLAGQLVASSFRGAVRINGTSVPFG